jgi:hypothetical protein
LRLAGKDRGKARRNALIDGIARSDRFKPGAGLRVAPRLKLIAGKDRISHARASAAHTVKHDMRNRALSDLIFPSRFTNDGADEKVSILRR